MQMLIDLQASEQASFFFIR